MPAILEKPVSPKAPKVSIDTYRIGGNGSVPHTNGQSAAYALPAPPLAPLVDMQTLPLTRSMVFALEDAGLLKGSHWQLINGRIIIDMRLSPQHRVA